MNTFVTAIGIALATACAAAAGASPAYHLDREKGLSGDDGWDYLVADAGSGRLYVTHGTRVQVLKLSDLSAAGEIAATPGVHGVALAPDLGRGYVSAGRSDSIIVFDLASLARVADIKSGGGNPDAILYDAPTHQVFAFNGRGRSTTVINAVDNTVVATLPLGAKPEFAVNDLNGHIFVNLEDSHRIAVLDARARSVLKNWELPGCEEPTGLALDRAHALLFSVCSNRVMKVLDSASGRLVASLPIGAGVDAVVFDPATQLVAASGGDGTVTIVHEDARDRFSVTQTVATLRGARTLALDDQTHRLYTVAAEYLTPERSAATGRPGIVPGSFKVLVLEP
jgi:DNA-binding beta-propeller fold protein YncE